MFLRDISQWPHHLVWPFLLEVDSMDPTVRVIDQNIRCGCFTFACLVTDEQQELENSDTPEPTCFQLATAETFRAKGI